MVNIKFLEQIAKEQIDQPGKIQIEYQHNNIILVNTFLDELYNYLYNANDGDDNAIMELLSTKKIHPYYDNKLGFFKVQLTGILNDNNWCLDALCDELKITYSWLVHQLLDELKKVLE